MKKRTFAWIGLASVGVVLGWKALDELPRWTRQGAQAEMREPMPPVNMEAIAIPDGGLIIAQGDSLTRGTHGGAALAGTPYPTHLSRVLGDVRVLNRGIGGHRAHDGLKRWRDPMADGQVADLAIVAYGTNDAAVRGWLGRFRPVPIDDFRKNLGAIVTGFQSAGIPVLLLAPPPTGSAAMERRVQPYRNAVREVAVQHGAAFLDPADMFADVDAPLQQDGLHFTAAGNLAFAQWLHKRLDHPAG